MVAPFYHRGPERADEKFISFIYSQYDVWDGCWSYPRRERVSRCKMNEALGLKLELRDVNWIFRSRQIIHVFLTQIHTHTCDDEFDNAALIIIHCAWLYSRVYVRTLDVSRAMKTTTTMMMESKRKRVKVASRELAWIIMETKETENEEDFSLKQTFPSTVFFFTSLLINMLC